jgi:glutamate-1-semialdehyde 2,1-aminomutase
MPETGAAAGIDRARLRALLEREEAALNERTSASRQLFERAKQTLAGGVASSYQSREPWPIYLTHGEGCEVWDVDGNRYFDFHNGFGAMVQGHANPAITAAVRERAALGTHFAAPTEDAIVVAEELARRFHLPRWRFTNSGSESTMDAIRIARGLTGRDVVLKIFGSYHGHHDTVMVSIGVEYDAIGPHDAPHSLSYGAGIPQAIVDMTVAVPFNDADVLERRIEQLSAEGRKPACLIMEAAMMNLGVVLPEPGYLEAVREITRRHGVVLVFDEVKTGLTIAAGGAVERFGVQPDMVTLAKALGGGLPSGAIGATEEVMAGVEEGRIVQVGTFNGNPLTAAAARASLLEVLTPEAYAHLDRLNDRLLAGCEDVVERAGLAAYTVGIRSKGCVMFSPVRIVDYETFKQHQDGELTELAWLYNMNRGIFATPGREEEWTLSVMHTDEAVDRYVSVFDELGGDARQGLAHDSLGDERGDVCGRDRRWEHLDDLHPYELQARRDRTDGPEQIRRGHAARFRRPRPRREGRVEDVDVD